ncbi:ATP-binding protein [Cognatilysobacter bugurensis]|uniref:histidine kinase n=1 Tax=Cognatilysobacter bugurensis TaxID=543356 RepID=A0A918W6D7_9GAMM|nr:ATP-binding protein [Lysobacter bugurensis]GHA73257.1 two-component sensor histidine kinase [Lysobacter bugurensis]
MADTTARPRTGAAGDRTGLRNMQQLLQLRWIAVTGQLVTILVVHFGIGIGLPLGPMLAVLVALAAFNLGSQIWWRRRPRVSERALLIGLLVDVASLTAQLYLSGGITNPFVFLFVLQVALGTMLLRPSSSWIIAAATTACVLALGLLPTPVQIRMSASSGLANHYLQGLLICFLLVASLLVVFIGRIARILRDRDARLAQLRQRAAEEDHIVRMGLLASGAAHELGTPLSTLSVILGDWRHEPLIRDDVGLIREVLDMQAQVERCKSIVTRILLVAGETRGEAPEETTLAAFLDELADQWRTLHPASGFEYRRLFHGDRRIVADTGLQQMVWNVLDNALEVSPGSILFEADCRDGSLVIDVCDDGPGFAPAVLESLGAPYNSTKGRPGGGLGLFLSANVARSLGGRLSVTNRLPGGACVRMALPLASIAIEEMDDGR